MLQWLWERLTVAMLRRGYAELYMRHFLATEFAKLCADPVMRQKIGRYASSRTRPKPLA